MNWNRKTVLVTGGCGHIGSFVIQSLLNRRVANIYILDNLKSYLFNQLEIYCKDFIELDCVKLIVGDIADLETVAKAIKGVDIVFHLAAYADVAATIYNPDEDFRSNVIGTYNILRAALNESVEKFIFASSAAIYGDQPWSGVDEPPKFSENMKPNPLSTYANSKLWGENESRLFYELYGLKTVSLRYFSVYGPKQIPKPRSHSWVIAIFIMRALKGKPLVVYGGKQVRDFIYIEDIAEATVLAAEKSGIDGQIINIGTGKPTRIVDIANKIRVIVKESMNLDVKIEFGQRPKGDPLGGYADITKMRRLLGFEPRVTLDDGLERTLRWIYARQHLIPKWI